MTGLPPPFFRRCWGGEQAHFPFSSKAKRCREKSPACLHFFFSPPSRSNGGRRRGRQKRSFFPPPFSEEGFYPFFFRRTRQKDEMEPSFPFPIEEPRRLALLDAEEVEMRKSAFLSPPEIMWRRPPSFPQARGAGQPFFSPLPLIQDHHLVLFFSSPDSSRRASPVFFSLFLKGKRLPSPSLLDARRRAFPLPPGNRRNELKTMARRVSFFSFFLFFSFSCPAKSLADSFPFFLQR